MHILSRSFIRTVGLAVALVFLLPTYTTEAIAAPQKKLAKKHKAKPAKHAGKAAGKAARAHGKKPLKLAKTSAKQRKTPLKSKAQRHAMTQTDTTAPEGAEGAHQTLVTNAQVACEINGRVYLRAQCDALNEPLGTQARGL